MTWPETTSATNCTSSGGNASSEKAYATINDTPEAITFSWEVTTSPVEVTGFKPRISPIDHKGRSRQTRRP